MQSRRSPVRLLLALIFLAVGGAGIVVFLTSPVSEGPVRIGSVCNAGATIPFLPIQNPGSTPLQLARWRMQDQSGGATLPTFTLAPKGIARIWSADTAHALEPPWPSNQIFGLDSTTEPIQDIYAGRDHTGWTADVVMQPPGIFPHQVAPRFFHVTCDPAFSAVPGGAGVAW
jgi:hypothetical protein